MSGNPAPTMKPAFLTILYRCEVSLFFVPIENLQQRFADVEGHQPPEEVQSVLTPARLLCLPELDSEYLLHALELLLITNFKNSLPLVQKVHNITLLLA